CTAVYTDTPVRGGRPVPVSRPLSIAICLLPAAIERSSRVGSSPKLGYVPRLSLCRRRRKFPAQPSARHRIEAESLLLQTNLSHQLRVVRLVEAIHKDRQTEQPVLISWCVLLGHR